MTECVQPQEVSRGWVRKEREGERGAVIPTVMSREQACSQAAEAAGVKSLSSWRSSSVDFMGAMVKPESFRLERITTGKEPPLCPKGTIY